MAGKIKQNGAELDHTCENSRYKTNISKGKKHYQHQSHKGCVTKIYDDGDSALFLEHVTEIKKPQKEIYWLMWYFADGRPSIGESAVFDKNDIIKMIRNITMLKL